MSMQAQPNWSEDELAILDRVNRLRHSLSAFGDQPPPPIKRYRHQFQNCDFWFMFASLILTFMIFTSFIPSYAFEPLLAGAFVMQFCAMLSNLTRDRVELEPKPRRPNVPLIVLNFGPRPPVSLRDAQIAAGVKLVEK